MTKIIIYTDGGSRGNPGPAAIGVVINNDKGKTLKEYSKTIGKATNNEAEYEAVIFALKKTKALFGKKNVKNYQLEIRSDSELLVFQMTGKYKIKEENIQKLFIQTWNLVIDFSKVEFEAIPREKNVLADRLVNQAFNEGSNRRLL